MKNKFLALLAALGLALGVGLATAPTSSAGNVSSNQYLVENLPGAYLAPVTIKFFDGTTKTLSAPPNQNGASISGFQYADQGLGNKSIKAIYTPPGKCIWEELWGNGGKTWWGNFNHGQNGSGWWELKGWSQRDPAGLNSRLRWINCP